MGWLPWRCPVWARPGDRRLLGLLSVVSSGFAALLAALEMVVGAVAVSSSASSQYEWVEIESDYEPEPPCTMVETQGTVVFDIPMEARRRGLDEHGVSAGIRVAESQRDRARQMGWDEHELMYNVFDFGEEEGMRRMAEINEDDASSVVFQGGVVHEPRVCLALDELISIAEVRQACEAPEPVKCVQILFRGEHGLGVRNLAADQSLAHWYSEGKLDGRLDGYFGYFATVGGKILDSKVRVGSLGLGHMAEVVFHRRLVGGSFGGVAFRGLGSGLAPIVARLIVGVHDTAATGVGFLVTLMVMAWSKGFLELVRAKVLVFRVKGLGLG